MCEQGGDQRNADAMSLKRPVSVNDWADMLGSIFLQRDLGFYTTEGSLLRLHEEACRCSESLRKERFEEIVARLPKMFERFTACTNRLGIEIERAVWHKYPGVCPDCLAEVNCQCITIDASYDASLVRLGLLRLRLENVPSSISAWQAMHAGIWGKINSKLKQRAQVVQHLIEEVGEFSEAVRLGRRKEIEAEAADVFMWIIAVANRLGVSLEELLWERYQNGCDICRKPKCECGMQ